MQRLGAAVAQHCCLCDARVQVAAPRHTCRGAIGSGRVLWQDKASAFKERWPPLRCSSVFRLEGALRTLTARRQPHAHKRLDTYSMCVGESQFGHHVNSGRQNVEFWVCSAWGGPTKKDPSCPLQDVTDFQAFVQNSATDEFKSCSVWPPTCDPTKQDMARCAAFRTL